MKIYLIRSLFQISKFLSMDVKIKEPNEANESKDVQNVREKEVQDPSDSGRYSRYFGSFCHPHIATDVDSQIDMLRAAGIGIAEDDPTEPVLTLRMWVLGIGFCIVVSGLNTLYTLRTPSLTISGSLVLLLAYPLGKLWEKVVPNWTVPLGAWSFELNPAPFNTKVSLLKQS
jgi:hypothetical protein